MEHCLDLENCVTKASVVRVLRVSACIAYGSHKRRCHYQALSEAGQSLHRLIVESCGNLVLTRFIRSLRYHFTRFVFPVLATARVKSHSRLHYHARICFTTCPCTSVSRKSRPWNL